MVVTYASSRPHTHTLPFRDGKWTFMKCAYWGPSFGRYIAIHEPSMRTTNYRKSICGMFRKVRELIELWDKREEQ